MEIKKDLAKRFALLLAILGWVTIVMQLYLLLQNRRASIPETVTRFFSYFTILTNILVAAYLTIQANDKKSRSKPATAASILLYIVIVGLVYNIILRPLWHPQGMQKLVDESLHTIIPLLFIIYWLLCAPKRGLEWRNVIPWLLYPFIYFILVLVRGSFSKFYPYPFLNVNEIGYVRVALNSALLLVPFLVIGFGIIAVARKMSKSKS